MRLDGAQGLLDALLGSDAWPLLRIGLQAAFFLTALYLIQLIFRLGGPGEPRHLRRSGRAYRVLLIGLSLVFGSVLLYQASWQLTPTFRARTATISHFGKR